MKKLPVLAAVGLLALVPATAFAQTETETETTPATPKTKTAKGKTVSLASGKLRIKTGSKTVVYIVDKKTDCGYSEGQSGGSMRCSNLAKKKYLAKPVRVEWYSDAKKRRVATLVAVDMAKK